MNQIKKFIDKITSMEARQARELIIPISDAKELRDEIMKILLDQKVQDNKSEVVEVLMRGNKW